MKMIDTSLPVLRSLAIRTVYCTAAMVEQCSKAGADRASLGGVANLKGLAKMMMMFCNLAGADRASQVTLHSSACQCSKLGGLLVSQ